MEAFTHRRSGKYIRVNAGKLNIALRWLGSAPHLCGLMWQSRPSVKGNRMTTIPFGGTAPAMNAFNGGQVIGDATRPPTTPPPDRFATAPRLAQSRPPFRQTTRCSRTRRPLQEMGFEGVLTPTIWHGLQWHPKARCLPCWRRSTLLEESARPDFIQKQERLGAVVVADVEPAAHKAFKDVPNQQAAPGLAAGKLPTDRS
jgi:hypothetical protein